MSEYQVGFSKQDITAWEPDMQIWGWFTPDNRIDGVATPFYARAMMVRRDAQTLAYVCIDQGYVSIALREIVLELLRLEHPELGLGPHNLMLTATHTHAGPCGLSDVVAQTSANFGFSPNVLTRTVEGVINALVEAHQRLQPATLRCGTVEIPYHEPIAFNRSMKSYHRNKEVSKRPVADPAQATRRHSVTLRADTPDGQMLGLVNWFGVHATCIHAENTLLHADNKGLAAQVLEEKWSERPDIHPDFIAIFAQDAAGDVSPNFRYNKERDKTIGLSDDDTESARLNAEIHITYAEAGAANALEQPILSGDVGGTVQHADMARRPVPSEFVEGRTGIRTTHATWGIMMPTGTAEGPGPLRPAIAFLRQWMRLRRLRSKLPFLPNKEDIKAPFLELGLGTDGQFMKVLPVRRSLRFVGKVDPVIGYVHAIFKDGLLGNEPWLPRYVPVQLLRLGSFSLLGLPAEPTTIAGERLRSVIQAAQGDKQSTVVINGYANGYAGYITTPEEYQQQEYEGSYTLFGPWTLGAYQSVVQGIARKQGVTPAHSPVQGPFLPVHSYETLLQRRQSGRKGTWGRGNGPNIPEPNSPYLTKIKRALYSRTAQR
ncbi:MAG: hypothetical protein EP343_33155 [Deltaproteobacteria bacterium]|nr:MAG: hypothetical protein EP343_33155 [Deltaproteobacteria bacterium]